MPGKNTRLVSRNHATLATTQLAGTLPITDPLYPASNLLLSDRNVKAAFPSGDTSFTLDIGTGKTVQTVGAFGMARGTSPTQFFITAAFTFPDPVISALTTNGTNQLTRSSGSFLPLVKVGQRITGTSIAAGATVLAVSAGAVTMSLNATGSVAGTVVATFSDSAPIGTFHMAQGAADNLNVLASPLTYRYWSFTFDFAFTPWTLGKPLVGDLVDLGIAFSPNSTETPLRQRVHNRAVSGSLLSTTTGPNRKRISYLFRSVPAAIRATLESAVAGAPFILITPWDEALEVDVPDDALAVACTWGAPDLFDITLTAESLP